MEVLGDRLDVAQQFHCIVFWRSRFACSRAKDTEEGSSALDESADKRFGSANFDTCVGCNRAAIHRDLDQRAAEAVESDSCGVSISRCATSTLFRITKVRK